MPTPLFPNRKSLLASGTGGIALALCAAALPGQAHADTTSNSGTIVVTGEASSSTPDAPALKTQFSESTITHDTIGNLSDDKSLQTMLASQPSIFAYQTGPNGVGANIFFRAFNSGQFAETYDGIAINDIFNGGVSGQASTWNGVLFIPSNLDSVTLDRGINNPSTNSYNSLGGTVNFLPRLPSDKFGVTFSGGYGSFNSYSFNSTVDTGLVGNVRQTLSVDYRGSDGWLANTQDTNLNLYYAGQVKQANGNELTLIGVYNRNKGHEPFEMPVPLLQQNGPFYQYPSYVDYNQASNGQEMAIFDYKAVFSPHVTLDNKIFGGGQDFRRTSYGNPAYSNSPYALPDQAATYDYWIYAPYGPTYNPKTSFGSSAAGNAYHFYGYTTQTFGWQPKLTVATQHNTLTVGGNLTFGELHSREYWYGSSPVPMIDGYNNTWDEHDQRFLASIYVQDEFRLLNDRLTMTPGIKYIHAYTKDHDAVSFYYPYGGSVSDNEAFWAPTIGINYQFNDHLAVNFAFGQNEKLPDISAFYNDVPGTTASGPVSAPQVKIKPEHVNDYELGLRWKDGDFNASVNIYREDFTNIFVDQFIQAIYATVVSNGGSARYQGVEAQISDNIKLHNAGELKGYVNFSYNDAHYTSSFHADALGDSLSASGDTSSAADYVTAGERMADVPRILLTFGGTWQYQGFRLDAQGRYIGSQIILNTNTGIPANMNIPSYFIMDLGLAKTFTLAGAGGIQNIKLSLNIDNIFNKYYFAEAYASANGSYAPTTEMAAPGMPRSVMGKVSVSF